MIWRKAQQLVLLLSWATLALVWPGASLRAETPSDETSSPEELFERAVEQFDDGDFLGSRQQLLEAQGRVAQRPGTQKLRAKIALYLGLNQAMENQPDAARQHFREALLLDVGLRLDPDRFKPELVAVFEEIRRSLQGRLVITASRTDVELLIDGSGIGPPPVERVLGAGSYIVEARDARGKQLAARTVRVQAGETARLFLSLPAAVRLVASPAPVARKKERPRRRIWTWVAGGAAVAFAAVAIGTAVSAASDRDAGCSLLGDPALGCEDRRWLLDPTERRRYEDLHDSASTKTVVANISIGLAGALAAGAIVLYLLEGRQQAKTSSAAVGWATGPLLRLGY